MRLIIRLIFCITATIIIACRAKIKHAESVMLNSTKFFDGDGQIAMLGKVKIWQRDSLFIEEVYTITTITDTLGRTTVTYVPKFCRYISLHNRTYYDYHSFSDTAHCFRMALLPDSFFNDGAIAFYSEKRVDMMDIPQLLADTTIEGQLYKRIQFFEKRLDSSKSYSVGLFPEGKPFSIFSFEKQFSRQHNWFMSKIYDYNKRNNVLYALREIETLANHLSDKERNVFDVWEKFELNNPVKK